MCVARTRVSVTVATYSIFIGFRMRGSFDLGFCIHRSQMKDTRKLADDRLLFCTLYMLSINSWINVCVCVYVHT